MIHSSKFPMDEKFLWLILYSIPSSEKYTRELEKIKMLSLRRSNVCESRTRWLSSIVDDSAHFFSTNFIQQNFFSDFTLKRANDDDDKRTTENIMFRKKKFFFSFVRSKEKKVPNHMWRDFYEPEWIWVTCWNDKLAEKCQKINFKFLVWW